MARKQMIEGGTKNRIREVGGRQIFEHGYDGTSVRGIMLEVGGEVGLFYSYYKTKDELFTDVLDHFFEPYRKDYAALAAAAKETPSRALLRFFSYIKREVRAFRAKYEGSKPRQLLITREKWEEIKLRGGLGAMSSAAMAAQDAAAENPPGEEEIP